MQKHLQLIKAWIRWQVARLPTINNFIRKVCLNFLLAKLSRLFAKFSANFNAAIMLRFEWISMQTKKGGCLPGQIGLPHLGVGQDEKVPKKPSEIAEHLWLVIYLLFSNVHEVGHYCWNWSAGRVKQSKQSNVGSRQASYCLIAYRLCLCHNLQTLPKAQRTQANQSVIFNSRASGKSSMSSGGEKISQVTGMVRQWSDTCLIKSWQLLAIFLQLQVFSYWLSLFSFIVCVNDRPQSSHNTDPMFRESKVSWVKLQCPEDSDSQLFGSVQNHSYYILRLFIIKLD